MRWARDRRSQQTPMPTHVTMPLLDLITRQSMDEDYRHVAERRAQRAAEDEGGAPLDTPPSRGTRGTTAVIVAVFGILVSVAAVQTSQDADVTALSRASLIERIHVQKEALNGLQVRAGEVREENVEIEERLRGLRETEEALARRVRTLGIRTGNLAVNGPGVRFTVNDAPGGGELKSVRDEDLSILVDGLWEAGAEAISINGQRLTVLSPIQNAGQAIHVNVRPLSPPYEVLAIGDPETLPARFLESTHGGVWFSLARALGFRFEIAQDEDLRLPAAQLRRLRHATVDPATGNQRKELEP